MKRPKLIIVDNNLNFRKRLIFLLNIKKSATIVGELSNGNDILNYMTIHQPDILLIDVDIPELNGIEVISDAMKVLPGLKVFAFTQFGDDEYIIALTKIGVKGFILKSSAIFELDKDIHSLLKDDNYNVTNQVVNILKNTTNNKLYITKAHKRISRRVEKQTLRRNFTRKLRKRQLILNCILL